MSKSSSIFSWKRVLVHTSFWIFYVVFFGLIYGKYGNNYTWYFFESLCMLPFIMVATYVTIYAILPFYLKKRKLLLSVFLVVVLIFVVTLGERISLRKLNALPITTESLFSITFLYLMLETNFMVGIAFSVKVIQKWLEEKEAKYEMEKLNLETELNQLKTQLHPHFLFNTMNNLYALSLEQSTKTSEGIAKISDLLRSILYECNEKEIMLVQEIKLLKDYIDLEKLRYDKSIDVRLNISENIEHIKIAPMLLFTFAENCFKHSGIRQDQNHYIVMEIRIFDDRFEFYAENSKPDNSVKMSRKDGIGLKNVRKRLELIYPERYTMEISDLDSKFIVELSINHK